MYLPQLFGGLPHKPSPGFCVNLYCKAKEPPHKELTNTYETGSFLYPVFESNMRRNTNEPEKPKEDSIRYPLFMSISS
jgi:hypothetical protein